MAPKQPLKGTPQPKAWHPQAATAKWLEYKKAAEALATETIAERERRDREEKARTDYAKAARAKADKG